jgi:hypothetical protein
MSATLKHCETELKRLVNLPPPFGVNRATLSIELARALAKYSKTSEHASRIVQRVIETLTVCPTPAELIGVCREVSTEVTALPDPCTNCRELSDWVHQAAIKDVGFGRQEYHYSGRCNCARGRILTAKDRELQRVEHLDV